MKILLIEPFLAGSHKQWAEGFIKHSSHQIKLLALPGRHWKWRMHGAAVTLAKQFMAMDFKPDLILATDMLDLSVFLSLTRSKSGNCRTAVYFHENQLAYPWSPDDADPKLQRDQHYVFINYTTALSTDSLLFNSAYNRNSFLGGLPSFLGQFPDYQELESVKLLEAKSSVLPLGLELKSLGEIGQKDPSKPPLILWNHRWEHDKGPDAFFEGLKKLKEMGIAFRLAVLGEQYQKAPKCFNAAKEIFADEIVHWGYAESRIEYVSWLKQADFLPVTGNQDFFGAAVIEAMYCGVLPLLPNRLAYPEHIPMHFRDEVLYDGNAWVEKLAGWMTGERPRFSVREWIEHYDWSVMVPKYDAVFARLAGMNP